MTSKTYYQFAHMLYAAPCAPIHKPPRKRASRSDEPESVNMTGESAEKSVKFSTIGTKIPNLERIWSIKELLDEADREKEASKHVQVPQDPLWLMGSRAEVERRARYWHSQAKKIDGKSRLQKTSPALNCTVISLHRDLESIWPRYREAVLTHMTATYGESRILGVVEHNDEAHNHLHVFSVPQDGESFGVVNPGYQASREMRRMTQIGEEDRGKKIRKAYTSAMSDWQDNLHKATGHIANLERFGPRRMRLRRDHHQILKQAEEEVETAKKVAARLLEEAKAKATAIIKESKLIEAANNEAKADLRALAAKMYESQAKLKEDFETLTWAQRRFDESPAGIQTKKVLDLEKENSDLKYLLADSNKRVQAAEYRVNEYEKKIARQNSGWGARK